MLFILVLVFSLKDYNDGIQVIDGIRHSKMNNYLIFTHSYDVLCAGEYLYTFHHDVHHDLFKYSPTFALLMAPFAWMPTSLGLILWNFLNLFAFIIGLKLLPGLKKSSVIIIALIALLELMGSIQNDQSNGLMTGLILLYIGFLEKKKPFIALLFLVLSVYIKLFSLVFFIMLLFYPGKLKNAFFSIFWLSFFWLLPIVVIDFDRIVFLYEHWYYLLRQDHGADNGYSVMRILELWFSMDVNKIVVVLIGLIMSLMPLLKFKLFEAQRNRYIYAGMWLIWVVIFNHKSESPLFVIATTGVGLWYLNAQRNYFNNVLLALCIILTSLLFSDLIFVPRSFKNEYIYPSGIKAFPGLLIWLKIIYDFAMDKMDVKAVK